MTRGQIGAWAIIGSTGLLSIALALVLPASLIWLDGATRSSPSSCRSTVAGIGAGGERV